MGLTCRGASRRRADCSCMRRDESMPSRSAAAMVLVNRSCTISKVHGGAVGELGALALLGDEGVLRRVRGVGHQPPAPVGHQEVEQEERRLLHDRVGPPGQELPVAAEGVVLPQVLGQPGRPHGPDALHAVGRGGPAPDVRQVVGHPAPGAVVDPGRLLPRGDQLGDVVEQGPVQLGQVGHLGRPVVHLHVDVEVVVRAPGRRQLLVPQPLQVGGQLARAASCPSAGSAPSGNTGPASARSSLPARTASRRRSIGGGASGAARPQLELDPPEQAPGGAPGAPRGAAA